MIQIVMYATGACPYCARARQLLSRKGVSFDEIRVDHDPGKWDEMEERSGRDTVPQVFAGDRHLGGFDDLVELDMDGELDTALGLDQ